MTVRLLKPRGPVLAGTIAEWNSLCDSRGHYPYTYVRLLDGAYLCVNPFDLEVIEG